LNDKNIELNRIIEKHRAEIDILLKHAMRWYGCGSTELKLMVKHGATDDAPAIWFKPSHGDPEYYQDVLDCINNWPTKEHTEVQEFACMAIDRNKEVENVVQAMQSGDEDSAIEMFNEIKRSSRTHRMRWTFGIITVPGSESLISEIIESIRSQEGLTEDNYEIIIAGIDSYPDSKVKCISWPKDQQGWITKKKNDIFRAANFENIWISHDYVKLNPGWYKAFNELNTPWDCAMMKIYNADGLRWRDWVSWYDHLGTDHPGIIQYINYDDSSKTKQMYINGTVYCIKKDFALKFPLDESKTEWGKSEDVDFSLRARQSWRYVMNKNAGVQLLKQKPHWPPNPGITP
jgi:hypothetical protein